MQMNSHVTIERRRVDSNALQKGWQRDESLRKPGLTTGRSDVFYHRNIRNDASLVPPIRQTASIFKQPVTEVRNHKKDNNNSNATNNEAKAEAKLLGKNNNNNNNNANSVTVTSTNLTQDKPQQLFWQKRLEGLRVADPSGEEYEEIVLPKNIRTIGPLINDLTVFQSLATALHVLNVPVTGQTATKTEINKYATAYINPQQPLMEAVLVNDEEIRKQEERVLAARKKLQEALRS